MDMHMHSTTVIVTDQEEALRFYVGTLGWEKREDAQIGPMRFLTVAPTGAATGVVLGQPDVLGRQAPYPSYGEGRESSCGISLVTDDIAATYADLSAQDVHFVGPPETMPWGAKATWFDDPFGNRFFLIET